MLWPCAVSKAGGGGRLGPPKSITRAPATPPQRNTSAKVTPHTSLGLQAPPTASLSISPGLVLISRQRGQHVVFGAAGFKRGRVLLRQNRFRGRPHRIARFVAH